MQTAPPMMTVLDQSEFDPVILNHLLQNHFCSTDDIVLKLSRRIDFDFLIFSKPEGFKNGKQHTQSLTFKGQNIRLKYESQNRIAQVVDKVNNNLKVIPGQYALVKIQSSFKNVFLSKAAQHDTPDFLTPVQASSSFSLFMIRFVEPLFQLLPQINKGRGVSASYYVDSDLELVEHLIYSKTLQGENRKKAWIDRLQLPHLRFQLIVKYLAFYFRFIEDVNGQLGIRMNSTVLYSARRTFLQLARAFVLYKGLTKDTYLGLFENLYELGLNTYKKDFKQGLFPDPDYLPEHLEWLSKTSQRYLQDFNRNLKINIGLRFVNSIINSDTSSSNLGGIPDEEYVSPPRIENLDQLDQVLKAYQTSSEILIQNIPIPYQATDQIKLVGSVANGFGHHRSDIDLVILTKTLPVNNIDSLSATEGHLEFRCPDTTSGHLVNVEFLSQDLARLMKDWIEEADAVVEKWMMEQAANLEMIDTIQQFCKSIYIATCHRFFTGITLRPGSPLVEQKDQLFKQFLQVTAISHFVNYLYCEKRAASYDDYKMQESILLIRLKGTEHLLQALLCSKGDFLWGSKRWILEFIARYKQPLLFAHARNIMFPKVQSPQFDLKEQELSTTFIITEIKKNIALAEKLSIIERGIDQF